MFQIYNVVCIYGIDEVLKSSLEGLINEFRSFYCTDVNVYINFHLFLKEELSEIKFNKVGIIDEKTGETVEDLLDKILKETNCKINSCINGNEELLDSWSTDDTLSAQENKEQSTRKPLGNTIIEKKEEYVEVTDEKNNEEQNNEYFGGITDINLSNMKVRTMNPHAAPPFVQTPTATSNPQQQTNPQQFYPIYQPLAPSAAIMVPNLLQSIHSPDEEHRRVVADKVGHKLVEKKCRKVGPSFLGEIGEFITIHNVEFELGDEQEWWIVVPESASDDEGRRYAQYVEDCTLKGGEPVSFDVYMESVDMIFNILK